MIGQPINHLTVSRFVTAFVAACGLHAGVAWHLTQTPQVTQEGFSDDAIAIDLPALTAGSEADSDASVPQTANLAAEPPPPKDVEPEQSSEPLIPVEQAPLAPDPIVSLPPSPQEAQAPEDKTQSTPEPPLEKPLEEPAPQEPKKQPAEAEPAHSVTESQTADKTEIAATNDAEASAFSRKGSAGAAEASAGAMGAYAAEVRARILGRRPKGRGLNGITVIRFELTADGSLRSARVTRSSGHAELDMNALAAVEGTAFPKPPEGASTAQLSFSIPFHYR